MADNFPITTAQIVGLFMECILYGIYLVTLAQCLRTLIWSERFKMNSQINWPMLIVALLMFTFATLDVAFGLRHNLQAFIYYSGKGGAAAEFEIISNWVNVMKTVDYLVQTLIGDALLIYRCYLVYERNWKMIIPSLIIWLGSLSCGIVVIIIFATLNTSALLNVSQAEPFISAVLGTTLAMNILTTSLIVYRIWSVDRQTSRVLSSTVQASRLRYIVEVLVESAALYTVSVFVFVVTYAVQSNANYGTSDNVVQIIGISFNLIINRVSSGQSFETTTVPTITATTTSNATRRHTFQTHIQLSGLPSPQGSHEKSPPLHIRDKVDYTTMTHEPGLL